MGLTKLPSMAMVAVFLMAPSFGQPTYPPEANFQILALAVELSPFIGGGVR